MAMLIDKIDISRLMVFAQLIDDPKLKKEKKSTKVDNDESDGHGHFKNQNFFFWTMLF